LCGTAGTRCCSHQIGRGPRRRETATGRDRRGQFHGELRQGDARRRWRISRHRRCACCGTTLPPVGCDISPAARGGELRSHAVGTDYIAPNIGRRAAPGRAGVAVSFISASTPRISPDRKTPQVGRSPANFFLFFSVVLSVLFFFFDNAPGSKPVELM